MAEADNILELARRTLDSFDDPGTSLSAVVRQAYRIAVRRHDFATQVWLLLQLSDLTVGAGRDELAELEDKLKTLLGKAEGDAEYRRQAERYFATRKKADGEDFHGLDVEQLEANLTQTQAIYEDYGVAPIGLTPIDTYHVKKQNDRSQANLIPLLGAQRAIVARIKQGVHAYLTAAEAELETGGPSPASSTTSKCT